eukprot:CAMPEP_0182812054 /NCGR_PEP_ID=MMETSP0006_2-20121128/8601_1 /TAXON_ID=97485 /ORGANISM="Prymnesium parvum, Strain Texoma1" /LENGTH=86 /DNA_ID=CAMNT_0024938057 /DNA_START=1044 /DNA_END=1304 /DNA_ORIENTATION=-
MARYLGILNAAKAFLPQAPAEELLDERDPDELYGMDDGHPDSRAESGDHVPEHLLYSTQDTAAVDLQLHAAVPPCEALVVGVDVVS